MSVDARPQDEANSLTTTSASESPAFSWTAPSPWVRAWTVRNLPLRRLLPDQEPEYVSSGLYVMGVLTLAAFIVVIISGVVLAVGGVQWWHHSTLGALMNSVHFWGVQAFFLFMAVHALFNFFIMAWRGGRGFTWVTGVLAFLLAVVTAFTGFLMLTNWDGQYVGQQAKDAFNAMGVGAVWNVMDVGQQFTMHVVVTAGLLGFIVMVHLGQVRRRGVAPPPGAEALEVPDELAADDLPTSRHHKSPEAAAAAPEADQHREQVEP